MAYCGSRSFALCLLRHRGCQPHNDGFALKHNVRTDVKMAAEVFAVWTEAYLLNIPTEIFSQALW